MPEPATSPSEAHNAVETGLGCTAEDWRWTARERRRRPFAHVAGLRPACGRDARAPRDGARMQSTMPSRPALGALPRTGAGAARERGRRPLAHVAGLRPAKRRQERHAQATHTPAQGVVMGVMVSSRKRGPPWERGHLARNGPKARKAPTGATCPSRLLPRPRRTMPSRPALGALPRTGAGQPESVGVARLPMWRACGPLAGETPALPGTAPVCRAQCRRGRPWVHCRGLALDSPRA